MSPRTPFVGETILLRRIANLNEVGLENAYDYVTRIERAAAIPTFATETVRPESIDDDYLVA
jgi:hypothetical protein